MKAIFGQQTTKVKQLADIISQDISAGKYKAGNVSQGVVDQGCLPKTAASDL